MGRPDTAARSNLILLVAALGLAVVLGSQLNSCTREDMMLAACGLAICVALALTPVAISLSRRLNVMDVPDERKGHERPMPLLGGVAVLAAFALAGAAGVGALPLACVPVALRSQLIATLVGGALIAGMGLADDKWGLRPGVRIIGQLAAVCLVMKYGVVMTFLPPTPIGQVGEVILTVVWIVGITNALNFLDGLDGLASGVATVAALSFGVIAAMTNQFALATAAFALAGATLGFLKFNFRPARVYLGDSGATFLGFTLACLGIIGDWGRPDRAENLFVPIIVLGIPIYDTIYITIYRVKTGVVRSLSGWASYVGRDHLHHRLEQLGMRPGRVCLFICLGCVVLGILAVILQTKGELDRYDKFLAIIVAAIMFVGATILMELGKARQDNGR